MKSNHNRIDMPGFELLNLGDGGLLVPSVVLAQHKQLVLEERLAMAARKKADEERKHADTEKNKALMSAGPYELVTVLARGDAVLEATEQLVVSLLESQTKGLDDYTVTSCRDVIVGAALRMVYEGNVPTWDMVLDYLIGPGWDCVTQIALDLYQQKPHVMETPAGQWIKTHMEYLPGMDDAALQRLINRSAAMLKDALACVRNPAPEAGTGKAKARRVRKQPVIQIFRPEALAKADAHLGRLDSKDRDRAGHDLAQARTNDGFRLLPNVRKAVANLTRLAEKFENLADPIAHLKSELTLAGAMNASNFRISPILLLGDPGIGKTHLAMQLATALGVPMAKVSAGGSAASFQLVGSHGSWNRAMPGSVFTLLASNSSAAPVMVIDEVDKLGGGNYSLQPTLLDMLEPTSARHFKDEFYDLEFDASRIVFVLTANTLRTVPEPLLSRVAVFHVPRPQPNQRLRIIQGELMHLQKKTRKRIELDTSAHNLAERVDVDLRQTIRVVTEAFSKAMTDGSSKATITVPPHAGSVIVFLHSATIH
ncbi:MAG: AAA family ATPase [Sterolibacterium sp.]|jgi:ATP-dependent Lon protease